MGGICSAISSGVWELSKYKELMSGVGMYGVYLGPEYSLTRNFSKQSGHGTTEF